MKLIGFNFTKIHAEKSAKNENNIKVGVNIDITDISDVQTNFFEVKEGLLSVKFEYSVNYSADYAKIVLAGFLLLSVPQKESKDILAKWKDKKMDDSFRMDVFNLILRKTTIKTLELEEELNLPYHIQMPFIKKESSEDPQNESE